MTVEFLLGVDGGGTGTRALLARARGGVIGRGEAGPSALGQGIVQAWRNVELAMRRAFVSAGLPVPSWDRCAVAVALSGVSHAPWRDGFLAAAPGFAWLEAETDSFAMVLGAHAGRPGAVVAAGTGSIGEVLREDGSRCTVGGWGFPVGDEGSGAWLGLQAVRHAQAALDGRVPAGELARRVWESCGAERESLQAWCSGAGQFAYAQWARAVFECEAVDPVAAQLLAAAASALESIAWALDRDGRLPLAVCGSIGCRLAPRFSAALRSRLVEAAEGPAAGALALIREVVAHKELEEAV